MEDKFIERQDASQSPPRDTKAAAKRIVAIIFAIALTIGASVAFYHVIKGTYPNNLISRFSVHNWISLKGKDTTDAVSAHNLAGRPVLRIAIAPILSPEKSMEMYQSFVDYVGAKLGRKPSALYRPTYSEINDLVRYQRCDIAIICTYPFIRGEREFGMQALVVPEIKGEQAYQSIIVVPKTSRAASLLDLAGKRFASADIISTTGWLFPAMLLMDSGENPNKFFGEHILTGSHDRSLQAVIDGFVDGAAVHGMVYGQMVAEDPSIQQKVKILATSQPFGIPPIVVHPNLDPALREAVLSVLLDMHKDAQGKQILSALQIERFVIPDGNFFAPLRLAVSKLEKWR
jgi:phosphonate transport system substrate-binding protein